MNFTYLKDRNDFHDLIKRLYKDDLCINHTGHFDGSAFNDIEDWLYFFEAENPDRGSDREVLENIIQYGPFGKEPKRYPAIAVWYFERSFDRQGDMAVQIFDLVSIQKLKKEKEILCTGSVWDEEI